MTLPEIQLEALALDPEGPKVVAIGGGHGLAITLQAVQSYASEITAVVSVADDGGSSGRLVNGLGMPPPGDIRRCLLALTPEPSILSELFGYRFRDEGESRDVEGHSLGNLILAALADLSGEFALGVRRAGELLGAVGTVIPAARQAIQLAAVIDGQRVEGQVKVMTTRGRIERLILGPEGVTPQPEALAAIRQADQIILGPGSLFTSVMAALCVPGIAKAVEESQAEVVLVLNLVTQHEETIGLSGPDHLAALRIQAGLLQPGTVLVHDGPLDVPASVEAVTLTEMEAAEEGWEACQADVAARDVDWPEHDPIRLGSALARLA